MSINVHIICFYVSSDYNEALIRGLDIPVSSLQSWDSWSLCGGRFSGVYESELG
jgi:hypothetical protein